jgi:hypothetical protein
VSVAVAVALAVGTLVADALGVALATAVDDAGGVAVARAVTVALGAGVAAGGEDESPHPLSTSAVQSSATGATCRVFDMVRRTAAISRALGRCARRFRR